MFKNKTTAVKISLVALLLAVLVSLSGCYSGAMFLLDRISPAEDTTASSETPTNDPSSADPGSTVPKEDLIGSIVKTNAEPSIYGSAGTDVFEFSQVVRMVQNSVVQIYTESGAGSGVIISDYGLVITCNHVIDGASRYIVELSDGSRYNATLRGADSDSDLAILKIEPKEEKPLTAVSLGKSDNLVVGEKVIVIGNPLGTLGGTVTQGIISATERRISFSNDDGTTTVMTLIQTDAAINAGNSGGAMFNLKGELIGVVNAKYSSTGVEGLGFAIPIDEAYEVAKELIDHGYVRNIPDDGLTLATKTYYKDYWAYYSGSYNTALQVTASKYNGALVGKYIVAVNGTEVSSAVEYKTVIADCKVGDVITIQYVSQIGSSNRQTTTITMREKVPANISGS
ncbi:MAG: trypsin-like peptidase domain-containing protein [Clostridia bacterium]|nr:trypsin-like peptidase domain-containing protein [Clostridia bacterium]